MNEYLLGFTTGYVACILGIAMASMLISAVRRQHREEDDEVLE